MAVKDLVQLFSHLSAPLSDNGSKTLSNPIPPLTRSTHHRDSGQTASLSSTTTLTTTPREIDIYELASGVVEDSDVEDIYQSVGRVLPTHAKHFKASRRPESPEYPVERQSLLKGRLPDNPLGDTFLSNILPSSIPIESCHARSHSPVPATVVFAPNAAPLYLPKLDRYLSHIPPPNFHLSWKDRSTIFPPMGELVKLGKSIDDLETNATKKAAWRNRSSILGSIASIVLGIVVWYNPRQ